MGWGSLEPKYNATPFPIEGASVIYRIAEGAKPTPQICVYGGVGKYGGKSKDVYILDLNKMEWNSVSCDNAPEARFYHTLTMMNSKTALMFGGNVGGSPNASFYQLTFGK